jgi:hypothetical protein
VLLSTPAAQSSSNAEYSVVVMSDLVESIGGALVTFEDPAGPSTQTFSTNAAGATQFFACHAPGPLLVSVEEGPFAGGTLLGQTYIETLEAIAPGASTKSVLHQYYQPILLQRLITTTTDITYADPYHTRWSFHPLSNASAALSFQAGVGMLPNRRQIEGYEVYYQAPFGPPEVDYRLGIVVRTTAVQLGSGNLLLELDCAGHGFTQMPHATCFFVTPNGAQLNPNFVATPVFWTADARVGLEVSGAFGRGDNIILLSQDGPQGTSTRIVSLPHQPLPIQVSTPAGGVQDCVVTPPLPKSPWTCEPPIPDSDCALGTPSTTVCATKTVQATNAVCLGAGDSKTFEEEFRASGSITVKVTVGAVEASVTGEVSKAEKQTTTFNSAIGDGCGQCYQDFLQILVCANATPTYKDKVIKIVPWSEFVDVPCGIAITLTSKCVKSEPSSNKCNRICTP